MGSERRLIKLVRTDVASVIPRANKVTFAPLSRPAHVKALRAKLLEEVGEYLADPSIDELADVYCVVAALSMIELSEPFGVVQQAAADKCDLLGSFVGGIGMFVENAAPTTNQEGTE